MGCSAAGLPPCDPAYRLRPHGAPGSVYGSMCTPVVVPGGVASPCWMRTRVSCALRLWTRVSHALGPHMPHIPPDRACVSLPARICGPGAEGAPGVASWVPDPLRASARTLSHRFTSSWAQGWATPGSDPMCDSRLSRWAMAAYPPAPPPPSHRTASPPSCPSRSGRALPQHTLALLTVHARVGPTVIATEPTTCRRGPWHMRHVVVVRP